MAFDVEGARKAGYSDAEIAQFLAGKTSFDLKGAKSSGYTDAEVIAHLSGKVKSPGEEQAGIPITPEEAAREAERRAAYVAPPEPTFADRVVGTGEAGLATLSGITGLAGGAVGILQGISNAITRGNFGKPEGWKDVEEKMLQYASALTYEPRTDSGREQTAAVAEALAPLQALGPNPAAVAGKVAPGAAAAIARTSAAATLNKARGAAAPAIQRVQQVLQPGPSSQMAGGGAAVTDAVLQRRQLADEFGIPRLTKGQETRNPDQLKFERETAKTPAGAPLRERSLEQENAVRARLDQWVDQTGAERHLPYDAGMYVDDVLRKQYARDKAAVRTEYNTAGKSPEALKPIDLNKIVTIGEGEAEFTGSVIGYLNSRPTGLPSTGLTDFARKAAVKLGIADEVDGNLVSRTPTMKQVQDWRREISQATDPSDAAQLQQATVVKRLIDGVAGPEAGPLYRRARASHERLAHNYNNHRVISKLLKNKPGSTDRQVAFEDVFDHVVLRGSIDDLHQARRILQRAGPDGHQAWTEMRGQTLRWIREQATNFTRDSTDNKVISPPGLDKAIRTLDEGGSETSKLMLIFGKKGAQQLRDINDLVAYIKTVPPETALNNSNTAATLAAFADVLLAGSTGIPAPLATSTRLAARYIKDIRLRRRILEALGEIESRGAARPPAAPPPNNATTH